MKKKIIPILAGASLLVTLGAAITFNQKYTPTFATYSNGDGATYYSGINDSLTGDSLLSALRSLNTSKRQSTVGYSSMGTSPSGQFKYTDYDTSKDSLHYDSNGQPYGTKIISFYSGNSTTSFNREHVWPQSHGGKAAESDIHMPRPTIASENGSRGNSFYVQGMKHSSDGWDPAMESFGEETYRGDSARIIFYTMLLDTRFSLIEANSHSTSNANPDYMMGKLSDLIKWNINYPVQDREQRRNEGAEYLQGNRNPFIDHPEYACKIWGATNSTTQQLCSNASFPTVSHTAGIREDDGYTIASVNTTSKTLSVGDSVNFLPFVDGAYNASVSWELSDYTVASKVYYGRGSYTNGVTITALTEGTSTLTLTYSYEDNGQNKTATATVAITVSNSGSSGGQGGTAEGVENLQTATYTVASTSSVNKTGTAPSGSSASYTQNYSTKEQLTSGKTATLTLSGYTGKVITGITLNMKSNSGSGSGSFSATVGSDSIASLSSKGFNAWYDNTSYGTNFRDVHVDLTNDSRIIGSEENVTLTITASLNSLYIHSYTITYGDPTSSGGEEEVTLTSIEADGMTQNYTVGDTFSFDGVLTANYSDGSSQTVIPTTVSSPNMSSEGNKTVTLTYTEGGVTEQTSYTIYVAAQAVAKTLSSIAVTGTPKTSYTVGDSFEKPTVTATYSDSTQENVTNSATFTGYDLSTAGNYTVTVSYTYQGTTETTSYAITVTASGGGQQSEPQNFSVTYTYATQGTGSGKNWTLTDCTDQSSYWLCPASGTESIALFAGIFTGKTITSDIVVTINSGTYGTGGNPSSSTFKLYTSSACTSEVTSSQSGTLPTSKTYTDAVYTVLLANTSSLTDDLAIKITKPGKQIRLVSVEIGFTYTESSTPSTKSLTSITLDTTNVKTQFVTGSTFTYSGLVVTAHYDDSTSATVTPTSVSSPNMSTAGQKTITVTYTENEVSQSNTYTITVSANFITATVSKTYYVGDTIVSSDITVVDGNDNSITSFTFTNNNYQFEYSDAASGGNLTEKVFENAISYSNMTCSLTVQVQRKARVDSSSQTLSVTYTDLPTTYQTSTTEKTAASGVKFIAYNLANYSNKMQFKASGGYFQTTESMSLKTLTINNRETNALTVYGSTNGTTFTQTITGTNDVYDLTGYSYFKVMKNGNGAAYCASLTIVVGSSDSAENVANYIMYEDTNKQCETKLDIAIGYLNDLDSDELDEFMDSSDYVIATARERLDAWAANQHKSITINNGEVSLTNNSIHTGLVVNRSNNPIWIIIIITVALSSCAAVMVFRKKSRQY